MTSVLYALLGFLLGGILGWLAQDRVSSRRIEQHKTDLAQMESKFSLQFENLANRIFDDKATKFKKDSQEGLGLLLDPLKEKLQEFQKRVEDSSKEQFSLKKEIERIVVVNEKMSQQTEGLTRALKGDVKAQGNWGEIILEKILEESGLRKNDDYVVQGTDMGLKHTQDGSALKPDVVVKLPDNKHIVIDSKVSLTHYERYCTAADDAARLLALKDYLASIRAHVQGLEKRRYQDTEKLGTPDFVLMFTPIEGAYSLAIQEDRDLHSYAWDKKIVIVCPSTLFATLRTIASVWRLEMQNKNNAEIARQGGNLYDKIVSFVEEMQQLGQRISGTQRTYDEAMKKLSTGQGNIIKRTQDIKELGIKVTKNIPREFDEVPTEDTALKKVENG